MVNYTYVNGQLLPSEDACISVQDRSFRFGDGAFETIAIHNGKPYQLSLHQNRLDHALAALSIKPSVALEPLVKPLLEANNQTDGFIRVIVSRGTGSKGYMPHESELTIVVESVAPSPAPSGAATLSLSSYRKIPSRFLPSSLKLNASGLNSSLALLEATGNNAAQALQLDENDCVSEASSGNIFWVKDNTLFTPALSCDCLDGTTRNAILRLSPIPTKEVEAQLSALQAADCVFITNCAWGVWPVSELISHGFSWQITHPALTQLQKAYQDDITQHCA